jgi:hypothetical protein
MSTCIPAAGLLELPDDLLALVAGFLPLPELDNFFCACSRLRKLARQPSVIAAACMRASPALSCGGVRALFACTDEMLHVAVLEQIWRKTLELHEDEEACQRTQRCSPINWDEWALAAVELGRVHVAAWLYMRVRLEEEEELQAGGVATAVAASRDKDLVVLPEEAEVLPEATAAAAAPRKPAGVAWKGSPPTIATRFGMGISRFSGGNPFMAAQAGAGASSSSSAPSSLLNRHSARGEVAASSSSSSAGRPLAVAPPRQAASSTTSAFSLTMPSMRILQRNSRSLAGAPNFPLGHPLGYQAAVIRRISGAAGASAPSSGAASPDTLSLANVHYKGDSALRHACHKGDFCMVRMLLAHGADANARDGMPLALAAGGGHLQVARVLLEEAGG